MKAKIISLPTNNVVPSARQQYLDLASYFEKEGEAELAKFYRNLAQTY